ncbi:unnamed protein product [Rotaria sordida]|uniref:Histidine ammonia-lyase n=1 Tax=Rotaria sordida TaxID=392033 RepID=A0A813RK26_9BILA|nr:unnamed protein product [Rotaria sordida]
MTFAADGNGYALTNDGNQLIRFTTGDNPVVTNLGALVDRSSIAAQQKQQVQDPYSFRCIPQVHGASKDVFENVLNVFLREINSVTDNPNIFPDEDLIVSGGNFHGQPLALHLDFLSIAMSEIGNISERRTYQLISGQRGLPLFLVKEAGLNSGFMIPQYTAAGIIPKPALLQVAGNICVTEIGLSVNSHLGPS